MKDGNRTINSGAEVRITKPSFSLLHALSPACKGNTTNALAICGLLKRWHSRLVMSQRYALPVLAKNVTAKVVMNLYRLDLLQRLCLPRRAK